MRHKNFTTILQSLLKYGQAKTNDEFKGEIIGGIRLFYSMPLGYFIRGQEFNRMPDY
jgi:hypothetical protein